MPKQQRKQNTPLDPLGIGASILALKDQKNAIRVLEEWIAPMEPTVDQIASAVATERERCARIAETWYFSGADAEWDAEWATCKRASREIATAIRKKEER